MRRGDIVLLEVPFTDLGGSKVRPALVLSSDEVNRGRGCIIVPISSKAQNPRAWDVVVRPTDPDFPRTGLVCLSVFQCDKVMALSQSLAKRWLGCAHSYMSAVERLVRSAMGL